VAEEEDATGGEATLELGDIRLFILILT